MAAAGNRTPSVTVLLAAMVASLMVNQVFLQETTTAFNLDSTDNWYLKCYRGERTGYCLKDYQCHSNHSILSGGDIPETDIRDNSDPLEDCGKFLWCCTDDSDLNPEDLTTSTSTTSTSTPSTTTTSTTTIPPTPPVVGESCLRAFEECTWCVGLYRESGDIQRGHRTKTGLYCGGALIGGRVVLTSATCVRTVQQEKVRARLPYSSTPDKYYEVVESVTHPKYSSSTHSNDFALMVLSENVTWDDTRNNGACVDLQTPMTGECQVVGFTKSEQIVLTPVSVVDGRCKRKGKPGPEWSCGTAQPGQCNAAPGSPVLCPVTSDGQGGLIISGVTRMTCTKDNVLLGKVQTHADWLNVELRKLGMKPSLYNA